VTLVKRSSIQIVTCAPRRLECRWRRGGFSLVEAIASLVILGAVTVPIASGIASMSRSSLQNYRDASVLTELVHEAEKLRALPFTSIAVGSTSTSIELPGGASDLNVTVTLADYDGDAAADASFKLIVLTLDSVEIHFYRSDWKE